MKFKKVISIILVLALVLGLTSCNNPKNNQASEKSANDEPSDKILKVAGRYEGLATLDIQLSSYNYIFEICDVIFENLIGKDPETLELYPVLIEEMPEISEDGKTFTFTLKKGIKFHDGTELTSKDVEFSLNRFFKPETKCVNTWMADMIAGSKELMDGKSDKLSGFKLIDDYKFSIELYYPFVPFLSVLAASPLKIYPEKACSEAGDKWGVDVVVGTGPFAVEKFEPKSKLVVSRFDDYHDEIKKLDKIEFLNMEPGTSLLEFEAGTIDVCRHLDTQLVETYKNDPDLKDNVKFQEYLGVYYLNFNQAQKPLDDIRVREAIRLATDVDSLCNVHFKGYVKPANSLIPKGVIGHDDSLPLFEYNPEKAKQLLTEAGYPDGIEITTVETEGDPFVDIYMVLQEQYKKANIKLNIEIVDSATFYDKRGSGNIQFYLRSWFCDYVDPDFFLYSLYHSSVATLFSTGFNDPDYDKKLEAGRLIKDLDEKQKYYADLEYELTRTKLANMPLYYGTGFYLVSDRAKNVFMKKEWLMHYADGEIDN